MIRMLISPTRSGSTAVLRSFENNPYVTRVYHQPVKSGFRDSRKFDYSFFSLNITNPSDIYIAKETVGGFVRPETDYSPIPLPIGELSIRDRFPSTNAIEQVRPIFLFRDPLQTWNSINRLNTLSFNKSKYHSPFEFFIASYHNVFEFMIFSKQVTPHAWCVTLEQLAANPAGTFHAMCERWGLPYADQMINWVHLYGTNTEFSDETKYRMEHDYRFRLSKEQVESSSNFGYTPSEIEGISRKHLRIIERELRPLYETVCENALQDFPMTAG